MKIIALSGSLRKDSLNSRLGRLLAEVADSNQSVELATLHGIPLYDGDLEEQEGIPRAVTELRERIKAADGLIIITPEYNAGMPGVLKNALDWLTRPGEEMKPTFGARPTALAGATPGSWGTALAQSGALINLRQLGVNLYPGYLRVSGAHRQLEEGEIDPSLREQAQEWLKGFTDFITAQTG